MNIMVTRKQPGYSTIPLDQSYSASTPYSPWSGLSNTLGNIGNSSNLTMGAAQSPAVPYQQSMFTDKFNFNTPGYGQIANPGQMAPGYTQMAAYGPPASAAPPAVPAVGSGGLGGLLSDAWDKVGAVGNSITDSMKGFSKWGQDTGLLGSTKMVDGKEVKIDGWGGLALGGAKGLFDAYNSMQTFGLAKEMFESQKNFANANLQNGQKSYNTQIEGRQRAMAAGNPNAESVDSYMAKHRLG